MRSGIHHAVRPVLAFLAVLALPGLLLAGPKKHEKIQAPKLREITMPQVTRVTLDNGIQVFAVEDHELPLFRLTLTLKAGSAYDPKDKLALAEITAGVLRSGGSRALPGDQMDEVLENMGGSIETNADALTTTVSVNVLIEDAAQALGMLRDLLMAPAFPQDKVDLEIKQWRSSIARRNDDPQGIAEREFDKVAYGPEHPFAAQVEYEHLDRIGRDDLVAFHGRYFHPNDAFVAVWGDFDAQAMIATLRTTLGAWPRGQVTYPDIAAVPATQPSVNLVVKESVNQSTILIGHRGTTMKDPDYYALVVMNEILGGSFGSRLFNEVRSTQGLSYRVGSGLGAGMLYPGIFTVRCGTKSETTVKAARACIEEVRKMKTQAITPAELQRAKDGILNSHVFNFTSKGAIVNRQVSYVRNGYPADFLEQFARGVEAVGIDDVKRAAGKYLQPDQFAVLVVGRAADFDAALSALGTVNEIDVAIPEPAPKEAYPAPTPETLAQGKAILAAAAKAVGGVDNLRKVTNVTEEWTVTLRMMGQSLPGKFTRYTQYPARYRTEFAIMGQKMVQAYDGATEQGFQSMGPRSKDMDANDLTEVKEDLARDLLAFLRDFELYGPQHLGAGEVDGAKTDIVLMSPPGGLRKFKVHVDRATGFVVKAEYRGKNFQGAPVQEEAHFGAYKKVGSLFVPHKLTIRQDGEPFLDAESTSVSWGAIPEDMFRKAS